MASFHAFLVLGEEPQGSDLLGTRYPINICTQQIQQDVDQRGRPSSLPYPSELHLTMPVTPGTELIAWARDPRKVLPSCNIFFTEMQGLGASLVLRLTNAYCVSYAEHFQPDATGDVAFFCQLTIVAEKFTKDYTEFPNKWK